MALKRIVESLLRPFKEQLGLIVLFFLLSTSAELVYCIQTNDYKPFILNSAHGLLLSYLLSLVCSLVNGKQRFIIVLFTSLLSLSCFIDWICLIEFHSVFSGHFIPVILGTDNSEFQEFIVLHLNGILYGCVILGVILTVCFYFIKRRSGFGTFGSKMLLAACLPCTALLFISPEATHRIIKEKSIEGKFISSIDYIKSIPPRIPVNIPFDLTYSLDSLPKNICIIFGESLCRSHCQIYGYHKETMPLTKERVLKDSLLVYTNITSSGTSTIECFKSMMSTYQEGLGDTINYWECPSFLHVFQKAGYRNIWISNQSKRGLYDNLIGNYADLCDTSFFIGDKYSGTRRTTKDGEVLPLLRSIKDQSPDYNLFIVHLMGSHAWFRERYPDEFTFFTENDYLDCPINQRTTLAEYDNSVRYTDWVVNEVFESFKNDEAIVFFFPDHGLDLFHTRPDYYDHAILSDPESCSFASEIPFIVYVSPKYQARFSDKVTIMVKSQDKKYNLENLIYTLMDTANISFKHNDDVKEKTLFSVYSDIQNKSSL